MKFKKISSSMAGLALFSALMSVEVSAKAPEWSYSFEKDGFSLSISSSPCYDDNQKATMSIQMYGSDKGASMNASATCDCGEAIVIDDGEPITPDSFARLLASAINTNIKQYRCEAVEE